MSEAVALDCEMVDVGVKWREDALARVSIVDEDGTCLIDKYVKTKKPVTDYRTSCSGITERLLSMQGEDFNFVQKQVADVLEGRILVGHSLEYDLAALQLSHPADQIRDSAKYLPFEKMNNYKTPPLKFLARKVLGKVIQTGAPNSVEDAKIMMQIYLKYKTSWN